MARHEFGLSALRVSTALKACARAMRRVIWRYAAEEEARTQAAAARRKRRTRAKRTP